MTKRTPHTSTWPGKRVRVRLSDGQVLEGKFAERTGQFVVLDINGKTERIKAGRVRQFIVIKTVPSAETPS